MKQVSKMAVPFYVPTIGMSSSCSTSLPTLGEPLGNIQEGQTR